MVWIMNLLYLFPVLSEKTLVSDSLRFISDSKSYSRAFIARFELWIFRFSALLRFHRGLHEGEQGGYIYTDISNLTSTCCQRERWLKAVSWHVDLSSWVEQKSCHLHVSVHRGLHESCMHFVRLVLLQFHKTKVLQISLGVTIHYIAQCNKKICPIQ